MHMHVYICIYNLLPLSPSEVDALTEEARRVPKHYIYIVIYMCVCVCVCVCVCMCICIYTYSYITVCPCRPQKWTRSQRRRGYIYSIYRYVCIYRYIDIDMYVCIDRWIYRYVCIYRSIYRCTYHIDR